jgi:hypothetical protein
LCCVNDKKKKSRARAELRQMARMEVGRLLGTAAKRK